MNALNRVFSLQKKGMRIINFQPWDCHFRSLLLKLNLLKFEYTILLEIVPLERSNLLPPVFNKWFTFCSNVHNYETASSTACKLCKPPFRTNCYGKISIAISAINSWNKTQTAVSDFTLKRSLQPS